MPGVVMTCLVAWIEHFTHRIPQHALYQGQQNERLNAWHPSRELPAKFFPLVRVSPASPPADARNMDLNAQTAGIVVAPRIRSPVAGFARAREVVCRGLRSGSSSS